MFVIVISIGAPFIGAPNLQQRSWARCDEDYSCRYKTSCQNQLPLLQGGHVSHKTFSKGTPPVCRCRGGTCPTKRSLRAPLQCVPVKSKKSKFNCKLANGSHQSRCIQYQDVQCAHGSNNIKIKLKISTTMQYKLNIENTEKRNIENQYNPAAPAVNRGERAAPAVRQVLCLLHGLLRGRGDNRISSLSLLLSTHSAGDTRHCQISYSFVTYLPSIVSEHSFTFE